MVRWLLVALATMATTSAFAAPQKDAPTVAAGVLSTEKPPPEPSTKMSASGLSPIQAAEYAGHVDSKALSERMDADERRAAAREAKSDEHDRLDLIAQQQSAEAAQTQVKLAGATLFVSIVGAVFLALTWRDAGRTVKAAEESARIARDSLMVSQRPWVNVAFEPSYFRIQSDRKLFIQGLLRGSNVGNGPALNAITITRVLMMVDENPREVAQRTIRELIEEHKNPHDAAYDGTPVFPKEQSYLDATFTTPPAFEKDPDADTRNCTVVLVHGIRYRNAIQGEVHQTYISGRLQPRDGKRAFDLTSNLVYDTTMLEFLTKGFPSYAD